MDMNDRLQRVEDTLEIMKLQAIYGNLVDKGWKGMQIDAKEVADLFVEDGTWVCKETGVAVQGREQIASVLDQLNSIIEFYLHSFVNPIIDVNGNAAKAIWRLVVGNEADGKFSMIYGSEEIEYVRTDAGWRLKNLRLNVARVIPIRAL